MVKRFFIGVLAGAVLIAGCSQPPKRMVVGSKLSAESALLGEILAQHIQNRLGIPVERRPGLQGSVVAHQALISGQIDMYAEDSGSAYYLVLRLPLNKDPDILNSRVPIEYQGMKIRWMVPLGLAAGYAAVAVPDKVEGASLTELAGAARPLAMTASLEYQDRLDGLPLLFSLYPLKLAGSAKLVESNQVSDQLANNAAHLAIVSSVDPITLDPKYKVLKDDKGAFRTYPVALAVRESSLANNALLEGKLKLLEGKVSNVSLRKLLVEIKTKGKPMATVAREFLEQADLK
jgi:glycine betaine/choline ABC-type transport system substrate-binding protein